MVVVLMSAGAPLDRMLSSSAGGVEDETDEVLEEEGREEGVEGGEVGGEGAEVRGEFEPLRGTRVAMFSSLVPFGSGIFLKKN